MNYDIVRTDKPWHAVELTKQAIIDGYDVVVAAGGDGTANEVLNGLMQAKQNGIGSGVLGIISIGRGNDFAYGVGIPIGVEDGCKLLADGYRRSIDVGRVQGGLYPLGRYFGNGVGIGFDAVVGFESLKMKRLHGFPSYVVGALKTIFLFFHAPLVNIEYNNQTITMPSLLVSIMNGRRMGGGFLMAPEAEIDDGLFDLCIAGQVSRARIFYLILHFMRGTQANQEAITTGRTGNITVTAVEGVLPAHADGETLCVEGKKLSLELFPRQIEVISQPVEVT